MLLDLSSSMNINKSKFNALTAITAILIQASNNSGYTSNSWLIKDLCRRVEPVNLPIDKWVDFVADANKNTAVDINRAKLALLRAVNRINVVGSKTKN